MNQFLSAPRNFHNLRHRRETLLPRNTLQNGCHAVLTFHPFTSSGGVQTTPESFICISNHISFTLRSSVMYTGLTPTTHAQSEDRDSAVGTAIRYRLDGLGIESRWGRYFPHPSKPALGSTHNGYRVFFRGIKRPGHVVDHPPHIAPKLKKK